MQAVTPRTIVITGASSGIGSALAKDYAEERQRLVLLGRDERRLHDVAESCLALGAEVTEVVADILDRAAMQRRLEELDTRHPVDLLIANAGILRGSIDGVAVEGTEDSNVVFHTNLLGLLNTVHPILPRMIGRGRGQIAIMSSIAGLVPLPWCPSYSASKAAAYQYGTSLRASVRRQGVSVSVICPGFIDTPMTDQLSGRRLRAMDASRASTIIRHGLDKRRALIGFPRPLVLGARILNLCPEPLRQGFVMQLAVRTRCAGDIGTG